MSRMQHHVRLTTYAFNRHAALARELDGLRILDEVLAFCDKHREELAKDVIIRQSDIRRVEVLAPPPEVNPTVPLPDGRRVEIYTGTPRVGDWLLVTVDTGSRVDGWYVVEGTLLQFEAFLAR